MSFEIKYDRDGLPITPKIDPTPKQEPVPAVQAAAEPIEEVVQEEQPTEVIETAPEQIEQEPVQASAQEETAQARNFRQLREKAERIERERNEYQRKLQQMEEVQTKNYKQPVQEVDESYPINVGNDDLVEGKHLSQVVKELKILRKELDTYKQQSSAVNTETRIKSQFPDFEKVVTKENIDLLQMNYPEIAQTLNSSNDMYSTAVSAYTLIKKLGIQQEPVYHGNDKLTALKNAAKPKNTASISPQKGNSPLTEANAFQHGLTEDLKKQLMREMLDARKNM